MSRRGRPEANPAAGLTEGCPSSGATRRAALRVLGLSAASLLGTSSQAQGQGQGQGQGQAQVARSPRIVTVGGAITEIVYTLGAQSQLVGTDTTSLFPAEALRTPKVGYMRQLSAEGVLSLRPTALVATTEAGPPVVLDQLRNAGVQVELVKADHTWSEVQRKVQAVGRACARTAQAESLQRRLDDEWQAVLRQVAAATRSKPRVLFILSHAASPQVAGTATAADALIRFAGATNAIAGFEGYRPLTAEAMASAAPDVLLITDQGLQAQGGEAKFWMRPELALAPAFRRKALVSLDALLLLGFGPRLPQAVATLHRRFAAW
ncbi:heme/hemin ABC transporter substrate-binding protein [Ramlibacter sp.]|uniref:heme/hemin ABC transporter substrate-binding protein n=1 Tax=Ramlibacter sp. TaxID=1917967 RepID=UPI003D0C5E5F